MFYYSFVVVVVITLLEMFFLYTIIHTMHTAVASRVYFTIIPTRHKKTHTRRKRKERKKRAKRRQGRAFFLSSLLSRKNKIDFATTLIRKRLLLLIGFLFCLLFFICMSHYTSSRKLFLELDVVVFFTFSCGCEV